jgi:hypothetical protein
MMLPHSSANHCTITLPQPSTCSKDLYTLTESVNDGINLFGTNNTIYLDPVSAGAYPVNRSTRLRGVRLLSRAKSQMRPAK